MDVKSRRSLGHHEDGEIYVRGPQVMKKNYLGYNGRFRSTLDTSGWLRTGEYFIEKKKNSVHGPGPLLRAHPLSWAFKGRFPLPEFTARVHGPS